ncbi:hypothetical protein VSX64_20930 [Aurantimonas sp. C2-6-R+9]|uniref:hypothetical protein n=1 Tax=unclassified Aurantimonas TaxID=2638230 RepID=UPI002E19E51D|nr:MULTISPECIES: hypothetical protein [unclassified Aurantimonas]MEC5293703.1 hypothetical protein [Aurantimonas sp. C2-3-R2]MEC5383279.1 hypothetical protein [Aurantimonas sp. C2-6-R+9]MEC5414245.1 hypothetical protein [Aurantimonas sp. C2-4-R8]
MTAQARILVTVPLKSGAGRRVVAIADDGIFHVFTKRDDRAEDPPDQSFTADSADALARAVLAGDELAMTAPHTLRVLAAALLLARGGR